MTKRSAAMLAEKFKKPDYADYQAPQTSFRLNVLVTAKLKAIAEMYPSRSLNEIVNSLLAAALDDFESGLRGMNTGRETLPNGEQVDYWEGEEDVAEFNRLTEQFADELVAKIKSKTK